MPLTAKAIGGDFPLPNEGTHLGVCYMVVDLGIQEVTWKDKPKLQHKCMVGWELPTEIMEDGRPFVVSKEYTVNLGERANLFKDLVNWRGRRFTDEELEGFDIYNVMGAPAMLTVIHHNGWARVEGVTKLMTGLEAPKELHNAHLRFSFEDDQTPSEKIPEWIRRKIAEAKFRNWEEADAEKGEFTTPPADVSEEFDDDIPFAFAPIVIGVTAIGHAIANYQDLLQVLA